MQEIQEIPVFIPCNGEHMFAVLTIPPPDVPDMRTGIIETIGNNTPSFARNRMYRRTAIEFARRGYHVMRVDYRGNGDHSLEIPEVEPVEDAKDDFIEMARFFIEHTTIECIVSVASCFGGRATIELFDQIPGFDGVIALTPPLINTKPTVGNDLGAKVANKIKRTIVRRIAPINHNVRISSNRLVDSGQPYLMIYGDIDTYYLEEFERSGLELYRSPDGRTMEFILYPGRVHDYQSLAIQDTIVQKLLEWIPTRHDRRVPANGQNALVGNSRG